MGDYERLRNLLPDAHHDRHPFKRRDIPTLIRLIQDSDLCNRCDAMTALCRLRGRKAVPAMIRSLEADLSWVVRCDAAESLGVLGDRRAIPALRRALKSRNQHVRCYASGALAELKDVGSRPSFDRMRKSRNISDQIAAHSALYEFGGELAHLEELGRLMCEAPGWHLRYTAFNELRWIAQRRHIRRVAPWLRRALRTEKESAGLRRDIRRALAEVPRRKS